MFYPLLRSLAYLDCETTWYINVCVQYTDYKVNPMRNSIFFVLVVASLESGCGAKLPSMKPFKMEVQQGNVVTSKMLLQLRPGMTRSQVRYIMGTPLIVDSFRDNRWDYFYEMRKQGVVVEKRRVILDFDKDSLVSVRGDVIPSEENPEVKTIAETPKPKAEEAKDEGWTDKLKFWKADEAPAADKKTLTETPPVAESKANAAPANATENAPVAQVAEPAPVTTPAAPQAEKSAQPAPASTAEDEVVPYIPEGEYEAAPSPEAMAKANPEVASSPVTEATAQAVNEKTMATQVAETVEPPPVFEQQSVPAPAVMPEPEPVLPPPTKVAPKVAERKSIVAPVVAAPVVAAAAQANANTDKTAKASAPAPVKTAPAAVAPANSQAAIEDDEVIPYIPEGEYVGPPSEQDMIKGNMAEANAPATDAEAHQVTEKGVAPSVADNAAEPPPTFVAEQMPEPEPEPELPPPPAAKPAVSKAAEPVAPAAVAAADKPAVAPVRDTAPSPAPAASIVQPLESTSAALPVASEIAPGDDAEINQAVAAWAQAWRSKNIKNYLAAYAPDFVPEALPSRKVWEAQRKQRLAPGQGAITLVLNNLQVERDGTAATVQFTQKYAAKAYKDETLKTLEMRYDPAQKRWLITRERTGAVAESAMPLAAASAPAAALSDTAAEPVKSAATEGTEADVDAAVQAWAQAWRNKNINAYLAAYSSEFVPEGLPSRRAWEAQRKQRLSPRQGSISLEISNVSIARDGDTAIAIFTQKYSAKAYRDEMVKRLTLKRDADRNAWLIVRESAAMGADVPASKQQVTAPEGSAEHLDGMLEQIGF